MREVAQLTRDDLRRMKPSEIDAARKEGRLADVLAGREPDLEGSDGDELDEPAGGADLGARPGPKVPRQLRDIDLPGMSAEEINKARLEGRCDELLGRR